MPRPTRLPLIGIALVLACALHVVADNTSRPWAFPKFSDDAAALYTAAAAIPPLTGTDVVVISDDERWVFDADGKAVRTRYLLYKVLTQKGADGWDGVSVNWEPWHEEKPTLRVRVITPDHAIHALDPKTVTDAAAKEAEDQVYSDRRVLRAPLPAIAPGSLVEQEDTTQENKSIFEAGTVHRSYFGRTVPVYFTQLGLDAPASLPLHYELELLPDLKPDRQEKDGRVVLTFSSGPLEAQDVTDKYVPSDTALYPNIVFSTGTSWETVAAQYSKIVDAQIALSDVKPIVDKLVKNDSTRDAKAAALLQYLSREVRYTGVEFDDASIVPRAPAETLKRKYGDCKDKATLLVAMLRAAGIPSSIALLNAGSRQDVSPAMPGMGNFDHAIVYVPGNPAIWIDATDDRARLGQLASADQNRYALIAQPETAALIQTPSSSSADNLLIEKREFYLAENGPARIVEISEPHGTVESSYRSFFDNLEDKDTHKNLSDYVKSQYLADHLDHAERSDPDDTSKPFTLRLETNKGKRGGTDLDTAVVAIRLESIFARLPGELQRREDPPKKDSDAAAEKPKKPRTADYQMSEPFATEWQYTVVPPESYQPKPLPHDADLILGPAKLTERFSAGPDNVVHATIRFELPKRRFTAAEAEELRNKVADAREGEPILIYFEPTAQALLTAGKYKEAFQAYRSLVALHPNSVFRHLQMSRALLGAGMGQAARDEARLAVKLDPTSVLAQKTLAETLEYDLVGRKLGRGADYAGAEAAFRAAMKLDPDDTSNTTGLAFILEYNHDGERYATGARLEEAAKTFQSLTPKQLEDLGIKPNPAFDLFYAGKFEEALQYAKTLNPQLNGMVVACEAILHGSQAAMTEASKRSGSDTDRKAILKTAGEMLMRARNYPLAAELMEAGADGDGTSQTIALAGLVRKAKPFDKVEFADDPRGAAMRAFVVYADPDLTVEKLKAVFSRNAAVVIDATDPDETRRNLRVGREMRSALAKTGFPSDVMLDIVIQAINSVVQGDDASGYRVTLKIPGSKDIVDYVVKENGKYKLLDTSDKPNSIALEMLDRIQAGDLNGARVLLDWIREDQHIAGGDDPLEGFSFPRLWKKGQDANAAQMKVAAAALAAQSDATVSHGLSALEAARASATTDPEKLNLLLALRDAYWSSRQFEKLLAVSEELSKQYPDSKNAFSNREYALRMLGRSQGADALANEWLKKLPDDMEIKRQFITNAVSREDYTLAHSLAVKLVSDEKAEADDLNSAAWNALFTPTVDANDVQIASRAAQMTQQNNTGILHTLGCVYAETGKIKEARDVLIQAMNQLNLDEPESNYWYAFGRIAEQYGETSVALADYSQVEKPYRDSQIPGSSYRLTQNRLKLLGHSAAPATPPKK